MIKAIESQQRGTGQIDHHFHFFALNKKKRKKVLK